MTDWSKHVHRFSKKHKMTYKQANVSKKCKEAYKKRKTSPRKKKSPRRKTSPRRRRMNAYEGFYEEDSDIQSDAEDVAPRTLRKIKTGAEHRRAQTKKKKTRQRQEDYNSGILSLEDSELDFYVLKNVSDITGGFLGIRGPVYTTVVGIHNNKDDAEKKRERLTKALETQPYTGQTDYQVWEQPKGTYKLGKQWRDDN